MEKLTIEDFKRVDMENSFGHYYEHRFADGTTICLESCMDGYCIARYDARQEIIGNKICTELGSLINFPLDGSSHGEALGKAIDIANTI